MDIWKKLYEEALSKQNPRTLSPFIEAGGVSAALLTADGNIYTGVCIDTACSLGMCAERNAVANMITNGESHILKLLCVMSDGRVGSPCGACREMLLQLHPKSPEMEIATSLDPVQTVKLKDLVPDWWGTERMTR